MLHIEKTKPAQDGVLLTLTGKVQLQSSPALLAALQPLFSSSAVRSITVDLRGVEMMDSSGIATLVEGLQWARGSGGSFVLAGVSDRIRDALGLSNLEQVFTLV